MGQGSQVECELAAPHRWNLALGDCLCCAPCALEVPSVSGGCKGGLKPIYRELSTDSTLYTGKCRWEVNCSQYLIDLTS